MELWNCAWIFLKFLVSLCPHQCSDAFDLQSTNSMDNLLNFEKLFKVDSWLGGEIQGPQSFDDKLAEQFWSHAFNKEVQANHLGGNRSKKKQDKDWNKRKKYGGDSFSEMDTEIWRKYGKDMHHADSWSDHNQGHDWKEEGGDTKHEGGEWGSHSFKYNDFNNEDFNNFDYKEVYGNQRNYHDIERDEIFGLKNENDNSHFDAKSKNYKKSYSQSKNDQKSKKDQHRDKKKNKTKKKSKKNDERKGSTNAKKSNKKKVSGQKNSNDIKHSETSKKQGR